MKLTMGSRGTFQDMSLEKIIQDFRQRIFMCMIFKTSHIPYLRSLDSSNQISHHSSYLPVLQCANSALVHFLFYRRENRIKKSQIDTIIISLNFNFIDMIDDKLSFYF